MARVLTFAVVTRPDASTRYDTIGLANKLQMLAIMMPDALRAIELFVDRLLASK